MANEVKLPRLGQGMESGTIVKWLKSEGEKVEKGEPLYELDTDKVTQEVEAEASGVLLKIAVQEGEVPVGQTIAVIGEEGEEVAVDVSGNGAAAAQQVDEDSKEEGSPGEARDEERERGREASTGEAPRAARAHRETAAGSRPRRSRAGSPASAGSTWRRSPGRARKGASWPRTSSGPRRVQQPRPRRRLPLRPERSRSSSSPRCAARSRDG